jgi:hypothetical protein
MSTLTRRHEKASGILLLSCRALDDGDPRASPPRNQVVERVEKRRAVSLLDMILIPETGTTDALAIGIMPEPAL